MNSFTCLICLEYLDEIRHLKAFFNISIKKCSMLVVFEIEIHIVFLQENIRASILMCICVVVAGFLL